ncbi:MAG: cyclase family protein [Pseudomonadota bacterium]
MSSAFPRSIARRIDFGGPQSNYFGVEPASTSPMRGGSFVGDTREGGSCNASVITLNPHCHGTHTEGVGHVLNTRKSVYDVVPLAALDALLITLADVPASETNDRCAFYVVPEDRQLTASALETALGDEQLADYEALIVRTLPNDLSKTHRHYTENADYPFFTHTAMHKIVGSGIEHLLVDTPSLDRLDDGGALALHRQYWQLPRDGHDDGPDTRYKATVTEMIFVPSDIADGAFRLMFQPAPFSGDAIPSNPILLAPGSD